MLVNLSTQTQQLVRTEIVYDTISAAIYRLLNIRFPTGSRDKIVRLGLLTFSYYVFLQW